MTPPDAGRVEELSRAQIVERLASMAVRIAKREPCEHIDILSLADLLTDDDPLHATPTREGQNPLPSGPGDNFSTGLRGPDQESGLVGPHPHAKLGQAMNVALDCEHGRWLGEPQFGACVPCIAKALTTHAETIRRLEGEVRFHGKTAEEWASECHAEWQRAEAAEGLLGKWKSWWLNDGRTHESNSNWAAEGDALYHTPATGEGAK